MPNIDGNIPPSLGTPFPDWAYELNNCFIVDSEHDHSLGSGTQLSFNSVEFIDNFDCDYAFNLDLVAFVSSSIPNVVKSVSSGLDGELYVVDGAGRSIKTTSQGHVNIPTLTGGGFSGDYTSAGAECIFVSAPPGGGGPEYRFYSDAGITFANLLFSNLICSNIYFSSVTNIAKLNFTISDFTKINLDFNTGIPAEHLVTGSPSTHVAVDLGSFVNLSSSNTALSQTNLFYTGSLPNPQYFYGIFTKEIIRFAIGEIPNVENYQFRTFVSPDRKNVSLTVNPLVLSIPPGGYFGGVSQFAPIISSSQSLKYFDNIAVINSSELPFIWTNKMVFNYGRII